MKEFMFYIHSERDTKESWTGEAHFAFMKKCELYIDTIKHEKKLIAAQPLKREGVVISKSNTTWNERSSFADNQVHDGYYHI